MKKPFNLKPELKHIKFTNTTEFDFLKEFEFNENQPEPGTYLAFCDGDDIDTCMVNVNDVVEIELDGEEDQYIIHVVNKKKGKVVKYGVTGGIYMITIR